MRFKKILALLLAAAVLSAMSACKNNTDDLIGGGKGEDTSVKTAGGTGNSADGTAARNRVVIAIGSEPETLDPTRGWGHGNCPIVQSTLVNRFPRVLSGGELQRFCVARALLSGGDYLICDEISTMLDVITQA